MRNKWGNQSLKSATVYKNTRNLENITNFVISSLKHLKLILLIFLVFFISSFSIVFIEKLLTLQFFQRTFFKL